MNVREWALPVYTILMQLAVGAVFVLWLIRALSASKFSPDELNRINRNPILVIALTVVVAIGGSHFHLSRPFQSFLAVLNFQSSWLSREIVFTLLFLLTIMGLLYITYLRTHQSGLITGLGWIASALGCVLVYCMARIYLIPTQVAWNSTLVILSFYVTSLILGAMTIALLMVLDLKFAEIKKSDDIELRIQVIKQSFAGLTALTIFLVALGAAITFFQVRLLAQGDIVARTSLSLLVELYMPLLIMRFVFLFFASIAMGVAMYRMRQSQLVPQSLMMPVYLSCLLILVGEIIGRFLFYATHIRVGI
jgi:anaerobic dimethyl sulfoxide reductase subunit C (anchor subunit)